MPIGSDGKFYDVGQMAQMSPATENALFPATPSGGGSSGGSPGGAPVTDPSASAMPVDQTQSGMIGNGQPGDTSNPNNMQLPQLGDLQSGQGAWTSSSGGSGAFGGYSFPSDTGGFGTPSSGMPYGNYTDSGATGAMDTSGSAGTGMPGSYGGGGGGGGSLGMAGNTGSYGGGYAPGGGLTQNGGGYYAGNQVGNLASGSQGGGNPTGNSGALGSTTKGTPNISQTGGGINPGGPGDMIGNATPWNGGPQSMTSTTGYQPNNPGMSSSALSQTGFNGTGAGPVNSSMLDQYGQMMQNPMGGLQTAQQSMNPYQGGPQGYLTMSGFNGQQAQLNPSLQAAGFRQGGIGGPQTQAYNQYQGMLADPTSMTANPAYNAIMNASLQAAQRSSLASGGNGGGTMAAELAQTGAAVAGQYLPQMANMYQQGAQQELGNWQAQNQANQNAGALGTNLYGAQNQTNLGYGALGSNLYGTAGNQALQAGNLGLQGYSTGIGELGAGAAQQSQNYGLQNQANIGYGNLGANLYNTEANANLGAGNLANNMYQNAANNQFNRGIAYTNAQIQNANTGSAQMAYAQNQPANQYFQNQLTMQNQLGA